MGCKDLRLGCSLVPELVVVLGQALGGECGAKVCVSRKTELAVRVLG